MPNDPEIKTEDEIEKPLTQSQLNAALAESKRRTEKLITDTVAKAVEAAASAWKSQQAPKGEESADSDKTNTVKAAEARAQKRIEELERKFLDSEKARGAEAEARRRDAAQAQLRSHFEGANVRKEALDVLVAAATVNGMLRYDEDGRPMIAVKRSRVKGAAAEEQTFEDFKQGIEDWTKSPEAAAFIKAPTTAAKPVSGRTGEGTAARYTKEIVSEEEGVDRVLDILSQSVG